MTSDWLVAGSYDHILDTVYIMANTETIGLALTHWGRDEIDAIVQTTFWNAFSWMKKYELSLKISLKFVPKFQINNIPALIQIMAWRRPGDKPLSEPMIVILLTHICVTRPQWVNYSLSKQKRHNVCNRLTKRFRTKRKCSVKSI